MKNATVRALDECFVLMGLAFGCWVLYFNLSALLLDGTEEIQLRLLRSAGQHAAYFGAVVGPASLSLAITAGISMACVFRRRHVAYSAVLVSPIVVFSLVYGPPQLRLPFLLLTFLVLLGPVAIAAYFAGRALRSRASALSTQNLAPGRESEPFPVPGAIVVASNVLMLSSAVALYPALTHLASREVWGGVGQLAAALLGCAVAYELRGMKRRASVIFVAAVLGLYALAVTVAGHVPWAALMASAPLFLVVVGVSAVYWSRMR